LNNLESLTDVQLWNSQVVLELACGRQTSSLRKKRRQYLCLLRQNLKLEADLRGLPSPTPPHSTSELKPDPGDNSL